MQIWDVADMDCVFLTYDEPRCDEFWVHISNMVPWAQRVHGVQGSDAAHKAAAAASSTERFIVIDGDNIPDVKFFNLQLQLDDTNRAAVFRWRARNHINGLQYGNGGISCWTKQFVADMRTHEASDGAAANDVEFCFYSNYWAMHDCYSTTFPNATAQQAWRAGFREGVKMCLDRGVLPSLQEFEQRVHRKNYDRLCVWHTVGEDVENGCWAIYGARLGTVMCMLEQWDHRQVQDFGILDKLWQTVQHVDPRCEYHALGEKLINRLGLPIVNINADQSRFFKHHYQSQFRNLGPMIREQE